jgi:hypothetical protein
MKDDEDDEEMSFDKNIYSLLDSSLLKEYYLMSSSNSFAFLAKESMDFLECSAIFLKEKRLAKIVPFKIAVEKKSVLPVASLKQKCLMLSKSKPFRILLFNMNNIDKNKLSSFAKRKENFENDFFWTDITNDMFKLEKDVLLPPSFIFFHKVNHLFLFFA